ncbi:MAG: phosphate ABC transporter permease subunit PstC [Bacteroidota bacterium]
MKKIFESIIKSILMLSSTVTTFTVLLIIVFLFTEGSGLFKQSPVEKGSEILVNPANPVNHLTAAQIKEIYDQNITNWKQLGGNNDTIILFAINYISDYFSEDEIGENFEFLPAKIDSLMMAHPGILAVFSSEYILPDTKAKRVSIDNISLAGFITGREWFPTAQPAVQLGVLPIILGTLWVSLIAILIALPIGLATAIYMAEVANNKMRLALKPVIELLAGIPSVVYGFFGLIVIVPFIQKVFSLDTGQTALTGSILLAIMALPTIITVSEDAIRATPRVMKEASLALGANHWQTIVRVIIPYSSSGIAAAAILGIGRAIGETMAVLMVTGNAAVIPHSLLQPVRTIPATIAAELGEAPQGGIHYQALFALGCILFLMTMVINLWVQYISSKRRNAGH